MMRAAWLWNVYVCVVKCEKLFVVFVVARAIYQSNTMLLVVVVVVQGHWSCCYSANENSTYCRNTAYCDGCSRGGSYAREFGKHESNESWCQRYGKD